VKGWRATALLLAMTASAAADDTTQCLDASSAAQDLRREKHLVAAREQLLVCARATCPGVVQRDCATWLAEVETATPTVVLAVKDSAGADVIAARVELDGKPFLEQLAGAAVAIDPGVHALRVVAASGVVEQQLVIREGEKNRLVELALPPRAAPEPPVPPVPAPPVVAPVVAPVAAPAAPPSPSVPPSVDAPPRSRRKLLGLGVMGVGAGAIVVGAVFGAKASSTWSDAKDACGDGCAPGSRGYQLRDDARGQATISTVGFVVGGLAVAGGAVLFLTAPSHPPSSVARGVIRAASHGVVGYGGTF